MAALEFRHLSPALCRRRLRLRLRRQGQPGRPSARRCGRGPRLDPGARRARAGGCDPGGRTGPHRLSRCHPQCARRRTAPCSARLEPGHALHLAGGRPPVRGGDRDRQAADAADRGARAGAGRRQRSPSAPGLARARRGGATARVRAGPRAHGTDHRATDGADATTRRLHPQAHPDSPPGTRSPVRTGSAARRARRLVRRARHRRPGSAGPSRPPAGSEPRRHRRRRRDESPRRVSGRDRSRRSARRSNEGDGQHR